jgi:N-acetylmuramoyl-L-alanine amidase
MTKIYLSPSTQDANQYAGGGTGIADSEETWMRKVAVRAQAILLTASPRPDVRVGGNISVGANVTDSNNWGANWHLEIHTNAGGGHGTEYWYYTGSASGLKMANAIYPPCAAASNMPDRGIKTSTGYYALSRTKAPAGIVELLFHDNTTEAQEMRVSVEEFAQAIAKGFAKLLGLTFPIPKPPVPTTPPPVPTVPPTAVWKVASQTATTINLVKS